jgi:phytoene synthase
MPAAAWSPKDAVSADYSSQSNLAFSFLCLSRERRADMNVFYTFCRLADDIADAPDVPVEQKAALLGEWREALAQPAPDPAHARLWDQLDTLIAKYQIPREHFLEILEGVSMDLSGRHYATFAELRGYCHRVASVVGLVSIEIFGYRDSGCRQYALDLGLALQLTNIIRDVGADLDNGGRIYLPLEDLERFGYPPEDLRERVYDGRFRALMEFEASRAHSFYESAIQALPRADRRSMAAAEIMRAIYWRLLRVMRRDGFKTLRKRYRLNAWQKLWTLLTTLLANRLG